MSSGRLASRRWRGRAEGWRVVKWWDRFWGAVWMLGSVWIAYQTARWFNAMERAAPAELGVLRYGLLAFAFLFGLLVGAFLLSIAVIGLTTGCEWLLARLGKPLPRPAREAGAAQPADGAPVPAAPGASSPATDAALAESASD